MKKEDDYSYSDDGGFYDEEELRGAGEEYSEEELQREADYDDPDSVPDSAADAGDSGGPAQSVPDASAGPKGPEHRSEERSGSRRGGRRSTLEWIIIAVLVVVFAVSLYQVISQLLIYQQAIDEYNELSSYMESVQVEPEQEEAAAEEDVQEDTAEEEPETEISDVDYPALAVDYDSLFEINEEFVGVIYVPALNLTYPMAQTTDNTAYLTKTFEGTTNSSGCIFLDTLASPDFTDWNSFVFGHNMKNQTMFGSLKLFQQQEELCDSDPYIYIYQEDQVLVYRIFAYYTIPVDDDVYDDFYDEDGYDEYVEDALYHSIYTLEDGVIDWSERPNILTLSTCYSTGHTHNFIVQAALTGIAEL